MTTLTGRFMLCKVGELPSPGQCAACGACDRDCIHWGHDEDFVGVFLLCVNCMREAAGVFDPVAPTEHTALRELNQDLIEELERTRAALAKSVSGIAVDLVAFRTRASILDDEIAIANGARKG
jgi:hypothetical protein